MNDNPALIVECSCGAAIGFELGRGVRIRYTGLGTARVLAGVFRQMHQLHGGTVTETIDDAQTESEADHD